MAMEGKSGLSVVNGSGGGKRAEERGLEMFQGKKSAASTFFFFEGLGRSWLDDLSWVGWCLC